MAYMVVLVSVTHELDRVPAIFSIADLLAAVGRQAGMFFFLSKGSWYICFLGGRFQRFLFWRGWIDGRVGG